LGENTTRKSSGATGSLFRLQKGRQLRGEEGHEGRENENVKVGQGIEGGRRVGAARVILPPVSTRGSIFSLGGAMGKGELPHRFTKARGGRLREPISLRHRLGGERPRDQVKLTWRERRKLGRNLGRQSWELEKRSQGFCLLREMKKVAVGKATVPLCLLTEL